MMQAVLGLMRLYGPFTRDPQADSCIISKMLIEPGPQTTAAVFRECGFAVGERLLFAGLFQKDLG
jgi:hypothetical protein